MLIILSALLIGLSLGIFSSGGSILTVPLLVYIANQEPKVAIASSLIIVGSISFISSLLNIRKSIISWEHVLLFGLPSMVGMITGASLANFFSGTVQLLSFGLVMLFAVKAMWKSSATKETMHVPQNSFLLVLYGAIVGTITGFVGVGGGFLIVPALVVLARVPFIKAAATSLVIITLNSFAGFIKYQSVLETHSLSLDWSLLALVITFGIVGSISGQKLSNKLPKEQLLRGFSVFLLVMAIFIIYESVSKLFG
jgi:uncharacterized membrane protein YfcA